MLRRALSWWNAQRVANAIVIAIVVFIVIWEINPSLLFSSTTLDGGDAHIGAAFYLRQHWGSGSLTPWDPGWYDGYPLYSYYFVLSDALAGLMSYVIGFAVAFKITTVLGSVLMPVGAYTMGRLFRAPHPIPAALAGATLPFLFDSSFTIDGGNLFSTFAGEYSFSLSLALALVTIGLFARGVRTGRGRWMSAVFLSLTLAAHLLPWLFALVVIGLLVLIELVARWGFFARERDLRSRRHGRRAVWFVLSAGVISAGLSAWWLLPFATSQQYTSTMGYVNLKADSIRSVFGELGWWNLTGGASGDRWVIIGALIALFMAFYWRDRLGITLTLSAVLSLVAYIVDPQSAIWNERIVPFWYISIYLSTGWLVGAVLWRVGRAWANRLIESTGDFADDEFNVEVHRARAVQMTYAVALLAMVVTVPGLVPQMSTALGLNTSGNQVVNWAAYNYSGYQSRPDWPEYHGVITTMEKLSNTYGCGRAMWEYNFNSENQFGTPMALMLLPYWTNDCVDSMEGSFFESSATTPYHFLDQSELSDGPSDAMLGLNYGPVDVPLGVEHLQLLGVKYYFAFSPDIVAAAAKDPSLEQIAVSPLYPLTGDRWHYYRILDSPVVQPLSVLPNVVSGIASERGWLTANEAWWLTPSAWSVPLASSGPDSWPHIAHSAATIRQPVASTTVTHVVMGDQTVSFDVGRVGTPVEVKVSYYPRWHATGASGPYRISPNLMVVIPTAHHVTLTYGSTPAVSWGNRVTDVTFLALIVVAWRARRWRRPRRATSRPE